MYIKYLKLVMKTFEFSKCTRGVLKLNLGYMDDIVLNRKE